jgi:phage major head subunit gpT-like protein
MPFSTKVEALEELSLNGDPKFTTTIAEYWKVYLSRFAKGLTISAVDYQSPKAQTLFMNDVAALAAQAAVQSTLQISDALQNGNTASKYLMIDGKQLFANDHNLNGYTIDNLLALPLSGPNLVVAMNVIRKLPFGANGRRLLSNFGKYTLHIPIDLEETARLILNSDTIYESNITAINPYKGIADLDTNSDLIDPNDWYVSMTGPGIPLSFVTPFSSLKTGKLIPMIDDKFQRVLLNNEYSWLVDMLENTMPVHWFMLVKSVQ